MLLNKEENVLELLNTESSEVALMSMYGSYFGKYIVPDIMKIDVPNSDNTPKFFDDLAEKYNIPVKHIQQTIKYRHSKKKDPKPKLDDAIYLIEEHKIMLVLVYDTIQIYYTPEISTQSVVDEVKDQILANTKVDDKPKINVLTKSQYGDLTMSEIDIKQFDLDVTQNYNDELSEAHDIITDRLNTEGDNGIVLLYGKAGTGKTTYIRHLCGKLDKRVLYVPPNMAGSLTDPGLISFFLDYPDTILVIEDAENIIEERQSGSNQAVSNLLNMSDGLLGDCLKMQIICTFNKPLTSIDKALLRKGRLIAKHEFKELSLEKTQQLIDRLGFEHDATDGMTLSEIYNLEDTEFKEEKTKIGFIK